jgi:hypothetical protein
MVDRLQSPVSISTAWATLRGPQMFDRAGNKNWRDGYQDKQLDPNSGAIGYHLHRMGQEDRARLDGKAGSSDNPWNNLGGGSLIVLPFVIWFAYHTVVNTFHINGVDPSTPSAVVPFIPQIAIVNAGGGLQIQTCADKQCATVAVIPRGTSVRVVDKRGGWSQIKATYGGKPVSGWAHWADLR